MVLLFCIFNYFTADKDSALYQPVYHFAVGNQVEDWNCSFDCTVVEDMYSENCYN